MKACVLLFGLLLPVTASAQGSSAARLTAVDSLRVIRAGVRALGGTHPTRWTVGAFLRDSAGVTVALFRPCPKGLNCMGGGGRVRVRRDGRAEVLERYR